MVMTVVEICGLPVVSLHVSNGRKQRGVHLTSRCLHLWLEWLSRICY